jgi:tRNA (cmo5U34)-methyltransferase
MLARMTAPPNPGFFTEQAAATYDERNRKLAPITDNLHFLTNLVLDGLPETARVLCVGMGTGAEVLALARANPKWTFVGVDPSAPMLEVGRKRLTDAGIIDRCELVAGYVHDLPDGGDYDAVLSMFVAHFVPRAERADYFGSLVSRLRAGGTLVNVEMGFDLESVEADAMIVEWTKIQALMGGTPESLAAMPKTLREVLHLLSPEQTEALLRGAGIAMPIRFFQSFMIYGWFGVRSSSVGD